MHTRGERRDFVVGAIGGVALVVLMSIYLYPHLIAMSVLFSIVYAFYGTVGIINVLDRVFRDERVVTSLSLLALLVLYVMPVLQFGSSPGTEVPGYVDIRSPTDFVMSIILLVRIFAFVMGLGWVLFLWFSNSALNALAKLQEMGPTMTGFGAVLYTFGGVLLYLALRTCVVLLTGLYEMGIFAIPVPPDAVLSAHLLWIPASMLAVILRSQGQVPLMPNDTATADKSVRLRLYLGIWLLLVGDLFWGRGVTMPLWLFIGAALIARAIETMATTEVN